jgi:catechol 2,3-dioxygenase-like lactoylglutathione lyase family enzyme
MLKQIDHVNIVVRDLERCVAFYRDVLGLKETMRAQLDGDWIEGVTGIPGVVADCVYLQPPAGPRLELLCFKNPAGRPVERGELPNTLGLRHLAFQVDDIDAEHARLRAAGVEFIGAPQLVPLATVRHVSGRKRLCYFHDPEGVLLEIAEFR